MKKIKIALFMPTTKLAGSGLLFEDLFVYLTEELNRDVVVIDYFDGKLGKRLLEKYPDKIKIIDSESIVIPKGYHLIASYQHLEKLNNIQCDSESKIFFMVLHKWHLYQTLRFRSFFRNYKYSFITKVFKLIDFKKHFLTRQFVDYLINNRSLAFFSEDTIQESKNFIGFEGETKPLILPFVSISSKSDRNFHDENIINLGWVGRLNKDLVLYLNNFIKLVENLARTGKIRKTIVFHLIGDGDCRGDIVSPTLNTVSVCFLGEMYGRSMWDYLNNKVDIGFGRGRVIYDFSSAAIPSIIIPLQELQENQKGYALGHEYNGRKYPLYDIESVLVQIIKEYNNFSKLAFQSLISVTGSEVWNSLIDDFDACSANCLEVKDLLVQVLKKSKKTIQKLRLK